MIEIIISILLLIIFYKKNYKKNFKKDIYFCPICFEINNNDYFIDTVCKHKFHYLCLETWKNNRIENENIVYCPLCRKDLLEINEGILEKINDEITLFWYVVSYKKIEISANYDLEMKLNIKIKNLSYRLRAVKKKYKKYKQYIKTENFLNEVSANSGVDIYILKKIYYI